MEFSFQQCKICHNLLGFLFADGEILITSRHVDSFCGSHNHSKIICDKLWFSCEIAHFGKSSISNFQEFLDNIEKKFILAGRLGTSL